MTTCLLCHGQTTGPMDLRCFVSLRLSTGLAIMPLDLCHDCATTKQLTPAALIELARRRYIRLEPAHATTT